MDRKCEECRHRHDHKARYPRDFGGTGCLSLNVQFYSLDLAWKECNGRSFKPKQKPDRAARDLKEDLEFAERHTE